MGTWGKCAAHFCGCKWEGLTGPIHYEYQGRPFCSRRCIEEYMRHTSRGELGIRDAKEMGGILNYLTGEREIACGWMRKEIY